MTPPAALFQVKRRNSFAPAIGRSEVSRRSIEEGAFFAIREKTHEELTVSKDAVFDAIRTHWARRNFEGCVDIDLERAGGKPVLKGTRFTVAQVLSQIADGDSIADLVNHMGLDGRVLECLLHSMAVAFDKTPSKG